MTAVPKLGVLGGTFDPVHKSHLYICRQAHQALGLDRVHLVPCGRPVHRAPPQAAAEQRLAMLRLAVGEDPVLHVDDRELRRAGPSYTVDTLHELVREWNGQLQLFLLLGADAYAGLDRWWRWRELLTLAQLVVLERAENSRRPAPEVVAALGPAVTPEQCRQAWDAGRSGVAGFGARTDALQTDSMSAGALPC